MKTLSQHLINATVWLATLIFLVSCGVLMVLEMFVRIVSLDIVLNTRLHKRVASYYARAHNRYITAVVGAMVCLVNLYNQAFSERYSLDFTMHSDKFISHFRFIISRPRITAVKDWNWKRPWQKPQAKRTITYTFIVEWQYKHNIILFARIPVKRGRVYSWFEVAASSAGVRYQWIHQRLNRSNWRWVVKFPAFRLSNNLHNDTVARWRIINGMNPHDTLAPDLNASTLDYIKFCLLEFPVVTSDIPDARTR